MSARSHVTSIGGEPNAATLVRELVELPRVDVETMHAVYRAARDSLSSDPAAERDGYRFFWARAGYTDPEIERRDLPAGDDQYVVIGRHERCDIRLPHDSEISLRHLLARVTKDRAGALTLRLLDLKGTLPFHLHDDEAHRSIVAEGPLSLRLGRYVIVALPVRAGSSAADAAEELPGRELPRPALATSDRLPDRPSWTDASSHVTSMPRASALVEIDDAMQEGDGRITVERGEHRASVRVDAADLERGVLVGRADKCVEGVRTALSVEISRAHLLILDDGESVRAFDLCSTNGTYEHGAAVRTVVLSDGGVKLRLSGQGGVRLHWRRRPAA